MVDGFLSGVCRRGGCDAAFNDAAAAGYAEGPTGKNWRRFCRLWEEKVLPATVMEIVSENTVDVDLGEKRILYARLGIKEYFLFDPEGRFLDPRLRGFRTVKGKPVEMTSAVDGSLMSTEFEAPPRPGGSHVEAHRLADQPAGAHSRGESGARGLTSRETCR